MTKQIFSRKQVIWDKDQTPYLILHVYRDCLFVCSLKEQGLVTPKVILERDYEKFMKDEEV